MLAAPTKRGRRPNPPLPKAVVPTMALHGFGLRLRRVRKARGWSQRALSRACSARDEAVQLWETCEHFPSLAMLLRLRMALGCSWADLLGQPGDRA